MESLILNIEYVLCVICYLLFVMCYLLCDMCYVLCVMCYVLFVMCYVLCVIYIFVINNILNYVKELFNSAPNEFHEKLLSKTDSKLIIFGPQQLEIKTDNLPDKIELYRSVESFMSNYFIQTILS